MKTAKERLQELAVRLDQSYKDGKTISSTVTLSHVITLVLKALEEK